MGSINGSGYIDYSLGGYQFCGLQNSTDFYFLCITNSKGNKVALRIDVNSPNVDSIDKKVEQLQKMEEIDTVSIYDKHISIVGNYGTPQYSSSLGNYGYDPGTIKTVNERINSRIDELKIDRNIYSIHL